LVEWLLHKHLLHTYAKRNKWVFHQAHHRFVAQEGGRDHEYEEPFFKSWPRMKEAGGVLLLIAVHLPLILISPWLCLGTTIFGVAFYAVHYASHMWPEWGWRWVPWHMSHHMVCGSKNYGIVTPLWDWLLGTLITRRRAR
jgi:sterol desaturase/sphingolipid hydroxylase (fatty acid hydroxylase superfamily)